MEHAPDNDAGGRARPTRHWLPGPLRRATPRTRRLAAVGVATALIGGAIAVPLSAQAATTASGTTCDGAAGNAFYDVPASLPSGDPGQIVSCRTVTEKLGSGAPANHAWQVIYTSRDVNGKPIAVSGTVIVPTAAWKGTGTRPVVAMAPATQGLGNSCAFSKQLAGGYEYEASNVVSALKAGYAVAETDYQGYLNGQVPTYMVGKPMGQAVLDAARASFAVPGSGLSASTDVGIWGYSQGGAAATWAAQLASSYAPDLHVVAAAAGGVSGDPRVTATSLNKGAFGGLLIISTIGLHEAYPDLPWETVFNQNGLSTFAKADQQCLIGMTTMFLGKKYTDYTIGGKTLDQVLTMAGPDGMTWGDAVDQSKLAVNLNAAGGPQVHFPVFMFRGVTDEIIPTQTEDWTRAQYCAAKVPVKWKTYFGEHLLTDAESASDVVGFLGTAFSGRTPVNNC